MRPFEHEGLPCACGDDWEGAMQLREGKNPAPETDRKLGESYDVGKQIDPVSILGKHTIIIARCRHNSTFQEFWGSVPLHSSYLTNE